MDCSEVEIDKRIAFRKEGYFGKDEKYQFISLADDDETKNTVKLLYEAYYGNTPQKKLEAVNIRRSLRRNLSDFKNLVREYYDAEDYDKEDIRCAIRREVGKGAAFTAFKRWLLWDNREKYEELLQACSEELGLAAFESFEEKV